MIKGFHDITFSLQFSVKILNHWTKKDIFLNKDKKHGQICIFHDNFVAIIKNKKKKTFLITLVLYQKCNKTKTTSMSIHTITYALRGNDRL